MAKSSTNEKAAISIFGCEPVSFRLYKLSLGNADCAAAVAAATATPSTPFVADAEKQ